MENIVKTLINKTKNKEKPPSKMKHKFRVRQYSTVQTVVELESNLETTGITTESSVEPAKQPSATVPQPSVESTATTLAVITKTLTSHLENERKKSTAEAERCFQQYRDQLDQLEEEVSTNPASKQFREVELAIQARRKEMSEMMQATLQTQERLVSMQREFLRELDEL